jgi:hypothetical protein
MGIVIYFTVGGGMEIESALVELITKKPEFLLMVLLIMVIPFLAIPMLLTGRRSPGESRRRFVAEILRNPAFENRLKDPQSDLAEVMGSNFLDLRHRRHRRRPQDQ